MATALEIIESAFSKLGVFGSGETLSAEDAALGLRLLNRLLESWSLDNLLIYDTEQIQRTVTSGVSSFSVGPTGDEVMARPIAVLGGYVRVGNLDYPVEVLDRAQYNSVGDKQTAQGWPVGVYYEASMPDGRIYLAPKVGYACEIFLDVQTLLASFATAGTTVSLPPGYQRALEYNLAVEAAPDFSKEPPKTVVRLASAAKAQLKTLNVSIPVVDSEAAYLSRPRGTDHNAFMAGL